MAHRITITHLNALCLRLNTLTQSPITPYSNDGGKFQANIGNYHISRAYGGFCLHRMSSVGGGTAAPLNGGHSSAREVYDSVHAFIRGIEEEKANHA